MSPFDPFPTISKKSTVCNMGYGGVCNGGVCNVGGFKDWMESGGAIDQAIEPGM
jgi:hypothetical protein